MELEPYGRRLIAKQSTDDKIGCIIVPESAKKTSLRATVIWIGEDCTWVNPGDTILFGRYAKFDIPLKGEEWRDYFIMNEDDVLARVMEGENE